MLKFSGLADLSSCFKKEERQIVFPNLSLPQGRASQRTPKGALCDLMMPLGERYALHVPDALGAAWHTTAHCKVPSLQERETNPQV